MCNLPKANAAHDDAIRRKIRAAIISRNLVSASNNTRWDELIEYFRQREGWRPSYRSKSVTGYVSGWDVEWFYHLPFPFACVEWFDISLQESATPKGAVASVVEDHTHEFSQIISRIGFEFEVRSDVLRIWGYLPKSYEDFPPA